MMDLKNVPTKNYNRDLPANTYLLKVNSRIARKKMLFQCLYC